MLHPITPMLPSAEVPMKVLGLPGVAGADAEPETASAEDDDDDDAAVAAAVAALAVAVEPDEAIMEDASAGEIVRVLVLAEPVPSELKRASCPSICGCVSMNARRGPATSWVVARSRTLLSRG